MNASIRVLVILLCSGIWGTTAAVWAQKTHDDQELTDRFYITAGGFGKTDIRTTLRLDAKSPQAGLGLGDRIVEIEGRPVSQIHLSDLRLRFRTDRPGTRVPLTIQGRRGRRGVVLVLEDLV